MKEYIMIKQTIYTSELQILDTIIKKYENVKYLSKDIRSESKRCFYSHDYNGVGCAIGCLLKKEVANEFETYGGFITDLDEEHPELVEKYFSNIKLEFLDKIQRYHDNSNTVEEFLFNINDLKKELTNGN